MHLLKSLLMSGITMCGHIHIMVTRLRSRPGQESAIIKTQVLQKCLTTTEFAKDYIKIFTTFLILSIHHLTPFIDFV